MITRTLLGLAVVAGLFAIAVAPASAWFQSNGKATTGKATLGTTTFTDEGATWTCEKGEGAWGIQELTKGTPTTLGQTLRLSMSKWNGCFFFGAEGAPVKPCTLQLTQLTKGATTAALAVVTECVITVAGQCQFKIGTEGNEALGKVELSNDGSELVAGLDLGGITSTATSLGGAGCEGVKTSKNKSFELTATLVGETLKEV
jgi:hypothetical protein